MLWTPAPQPVLHVAEEVSPPRVLFQAPHTLNLLPCWLTHTTLTRCFEKRVFPPVHFALPVRPLFDFHVVQSEAADAGVAKLRSDTPVAMHMPIAVPMDFLLFKEFPLFGRPNGRWSPKSLGSKIET